MSLFRLRKSLWHLLSNRPSLWSMFRGRNFSQSLPCLYYGRNRHNDTKKAWWKVPAFDCWQNCLINSPSWMYTFQCKYLRYSVIIIVHTAIEIRSTWSLIIAQYWFVYVLLHFVLASSWTISTIILSSCKHCWHRLFLIVSKFVATTVWAGSTLDNIVQSV
jgi:hypothetical protein